MNLTQMSHKNIWNLIKTVYMHVMFQCFAMFVNWHLPFYAVWPTTFYDLNTLAI